MIKRFTTAAVLALSAMIPFSADAGTLRGSRSSMEQQHEVAVEEDLTFTRKASQVDNLVGSGSLVVVEGNADFALSNVSFPYARPEVLLFVQRLSAQYRTDNGARLIVTSLTRPAELQPRNAHQLSVHPAGMAVDFRVPSNSKGRAWLENALLGLENAGVLDVTREKSPPHYHVAVFPVEYAAYAKRRDVADRRVGKNESAERNAATAPLTSAASVPAASAHSDNRAPLIAASMFGVVLLGVAPVIAKRRRSDA